MSTGWLVNIEQTVHITRSSPIKNPSIDGDSCAIECVAFSLFRSFAVSFHPWQGCLDATWTFRVCFASIPCRNTDLHETFQRVHLSCSFIFTTSISFSRSILTALMHPQDWTGKSSFSVFDAVFFHSTLACKLARDCSTWPLWLQRALLHQSSLGIGCNTWKPSPLQNWGPNKALTCL